MLASGLLFAPPALGATLDPTQNPLPPPAPAFQGADGDQNDAAPRFDWQGLQAAGDVRHTADANDEDTAFTGGSKEDEPGLWDFRFEDGGVKPGKANIRDAWSPFGNGDMLERAMLIGYRANFRHDHELRLAFEMVTVAAARVLGVKDYGIRAGGPADFVAVEAGTLAEAVAARPRRKWVMKAGRVVARDGVLTAP